ncbi:phage-plasmid primase P4 family protein [Marine Group I thaumarchaeote SCGC AAA799-B03]|uniref:Phage-plasmid primase P4 family protein n=1 Tax=Marine Group I thaumarchaeote SCGC AAA799-B03 TaxID=1502289 RepID=A0A087S6K9_9ARCH|nr:phage-plasmid primase P4 family protein [Marine Group I thaumarchaeote SCGC AAA799-B03]
MISNNSSPNEDVDFWYDEIGVNPIPAITTNKQKVDENGKTKPIHPFGILKYYWNGKHYNLRDDDMPRELFEYFKSNNLYEKGIAIAGGLIHRGKHKGKYLILIDADNQKGIDTVFPNGLESLKTKTLVEQHKDRLDKLHAYYIASRPITSIPATNKPDGIQFEVKSHSNKGVHFVSPSFHKDGERYEIVSKCKIPLVIPDGDIDKFGKHLLELTGTTGETKTVKEIHENKTIKTKGDGGGLDLLRVLDSWYAKNPDLTKPMLTVMAQEFTKEHHDPVCSEEKIEGLVKQAMGFAGKKEDNSDFQNINYEDKKKKEIDIYEIADKLMSEYTFITLEKSKEILFYKDGIYQDDGENIISKRTRKIEDGIKLNHINEIKGIIRDETGYIPHDEFDKEEYKMNLKNKTINLKTGKVSDHSPDYLSRVKIPVFYNAEAKCPRFEKFLSDSLDGDEQKIRTVLEMMALCLIKDNSLVQKAFMNTGKGSNGKSVLFCILTALLGKTNVSAKTIHDFEKNRFASSSLEGKLANICADVGNKGISSTESLKKLIGGDPVDCERKFMDGYTFTPYTTLIFSANDIPEVSDESDGFARRFELIEWEKSFYGKDRDNSVKTIRKDPGEISGLFNKLMPICTELLQNHALRYESTVEDAKQKWLKKSDSTQRFLNEKCSINPEYWCPIAEIYGNYTKFAKELGMTPLNDRKFNAKLESQTLSRTVKRVDGGSMKVWKGITLASKLAKKSGNSTFAS